MSRRKLSQNDLEYLAEHLSDIESVESDEDPYQTEDDSDYAESNNDSDTEDDSEPLVSEGNDDNNDSTDDEDDGNNNDSTENENNGNNNDCIEPEIIETEHKSITKRDESIVWSLLSQNFSSKFQIPSINTCDLDSDIRRDSNQLEIFKKLFPPSLFIFISDCTNKRLAKLETEKRKKIPKTDMGEMAIILGCSLVMCYNKLPGLRHYWSMHSSVGNTLLKKSISRNRFTLLLAKMYFNNPEKPDECSKTYYIDEVTNCLKYTFRKYRSDSSRQSIDESMVKFKGRSGMKQYMPMKPVKRGIKIWVRSDSLSGYTYDFNIYSGKENQALDGTLGERVVNKLISSISSNNVVLCFDRFFTSVELMKNIPFPAVGTVMANRKNIPKLQKHLEKGESEIVGNSYGTVCVKWQDTKQVMLLSNCHDGKITTVKRKNKQGIRVDVDCPEALKFYNCFMGGVDLTDQMSGLYDMNRKSGKWWKKVFFRLLMVAVVNSWVIQNDLSRKKTPLLDFVIQLAEQLICYGKSITKVRTREKSIGRP